MGCLCDVRGQGCWTRPSSASFSLRLSGLSVVVGLWCVTTTRNARQYGCGNCRREARADFCCIHSHDVFVLHTCLRDCKLCQDRCTEVVQMTRSWIELALGSS